MPPDVTVSEAARALRRSPATVRRWIQQGAPTVALGGPGRGKGSRLNLGAVAEWKTRKEGLQVAPTAERELLDAIGRGLLHSFTKCPPGHDEAVWQALKIGSRRAAVLLTEAYVTVAREVTGREPDYYPPAIHNLQRCAR